MDKCSLTFLTKYINQLETDIQNYGMPSLWTKAQHASIEDFDLEEEQRESGENVEVPLAPREFVPFQRCRPVDEAHICLWLFMEKNELKRYLSTSSNKKMREMLEEKFGGKPTGYNHIILIEFLLDATIFCINSNFNLEQTSAILGIYYFTHKYFTDHLYVCPEDILRFFKDFLVCHSLLFPPTHIKLFNVEECKGILLHFCTLYLRHMPLIRTMSLPNFGFELDYVFDQDEDKKGKKNKKDKDKKDKSDKKSKKSKKSLKTSKK